MVVRHAEDEANPDGGADILSSVGMRHADLYPKLFREYLAMTHGIGPDGTEVSVCPIGKIIAIDPVSNPQNNSPGSNPYETIRPLAECPRASNSNQGSSGGVLLDGVQLGH